LSDNFNPCLICNNKEFMVVLNYKKQCMSSDSRILKEKLIKEKCTKCNYVRSRMGRKKIDNNFYENEYKLSSHEEIDEPKLFVHNSILTKSEIQAKWIIDALGKDFYPRNILEIGCGSGRLIEKLQIHWPKSTISGIDLNINGIKLGLKKGLRIRQGDISEITDKYDLILSFAVIEHLEDPNVFFNLKNNLTSNGLLLNAQPCQDEVSHDIFFFDHYHHFCINHIKFLGEKHKLKQTHVSQNKFYPGFSMHVFKNKDIITTSNDFKNLNSAKNIPIWENRFRKIDSFLKKNRKKNICIYGIGETFILFQTYTKLQKYKILAFFDDNKNRATKILEGQQIDDFSRFNFGYNDVILFTFKVPKKIKSVLDRQHINYWSIE
jgi:2-polyprenyl-3-methyl-5-hydroxy-6-metoxy-1,4-benzoquinol methylase